MGFAEQENGMFVLKIDFPTGVAYFTGRKKIVQGSESPGLTGELSEAKHFEDEEEAKRYCKMLVKKYDMDFYYSAEETYEAEVPELDPQSIWITEDAENASEDDEDEASQTADETEDHDLFSGEDDGEK